MTMKLIGSVQARLRLCSAALALVAGALSGTAAVAAPDYGAAIDMAGRQRMLTQRIVKAYCQVGMRVTPEVSRAQLDAWHADFLASRILPSVDGRPGAREAGAALDEEALTSATVPRRYREPGALVTIAEAAGRVAQVPIRAGVQITAALALA